MKRHCRLLYTTMLMLGAICLFPVTRVLAAGAVCPSGGIPTAGQIVSGGLEVNGICVINAAGLTAVTINGGIIVDSTGTLELENVIVRGGIFVSPGGELDVGAVAAVGNPTGNPNTIDGGITLDGAKDVDVFGAHITGGITFTGAFLLFPRVCGSTISGDVVVFGASGGGLAIGEPEAELLGVCLGNTIAGSIAVSNSGAGFSDGGVDVEGNTVNGSVWFNASTVEFSSNKVKGSAICTGGTLVLPAPSPDQPGNKVGGSNSCPN